MCEEVHFDEKVRIVLMDSVNLQEKGNGLSAKKTYLIVGAALLALAVVSLGLSELAVALGKLTLPNGKVLFDYSWYVWVVSFVPLYLIAVPNAVFIMKKAPAVKYEKSKLNGIHPFTIFIMCIGVYYVGNFIGNSLSNIISGGQAENGVVELLSQTSIISVLVAVILAPVIEEFIFRKLIIDRCSVFGEKQAIIFSAICFGLFHMNFFQFFYATALGLLFGYVYTKTKNILYSIVMHSGINFIFGFIAPSITKIVDLEAVNQIAAGNADEATIMAAATGTLIFALYILAIFGFAIAGIILIIVKRKKFVLDVAPQQMEKSEVFKTVYLNAGFILFFICCAIMFVLNLK